MEALKKSIVAVDDPGVIAVNVDLCFYGFRLDSDRTDLASQSPIMRIWPPKIVKRTVIVGAVKANSRA
jgi:hypothetical protein